MDIFSPFVFNNIVTLAFIFNSPFFSRGIPSLKVTLFI